VVWRVGAEEWGVPVKKGRHRRYEEARALKRSFQNDDIESLFERLDDDPFQLPSTEEPDLEDDDDVDD
jgi:hypothetical protein